MTITKIPQYWNNLPKKKLTVTRNRFERIFGFKSHNTFYCKLRNDSWSIDELLFWYLEMGIETSSLYNESDVEKFKIKFGFSNESKLIQSTQIEIAKNLGLSKVT